MRETSLVPNMTTKRRTDDDRLPFGFRHDPLLSAPPSVGEKEERTKMKKKNGGGITSGSSSTSSRKKRRRKMSRSDSFVEKKKILATFKQKKKISSCFTQKPPPPPQPSHPMNQVDPIMFTPFHPKNTFDFVRSNGSVIRYNVDSLVGYLLCTGDFHEPETRIPFSNSDLQAIDTIAKKNNMNLMSVYDAKRNKKAHFEAMKIHRDGVLGLERCLGDLVTEMMAIVEKYSQMGEEEEEEEEMEGGDEEDEIRLVTYLFPNFTNLYSSLLKQDEMYAKQCLEHFTQHLKGPPNKPTVDKQRLLPVILSFLKEVGSNKSSTYGFS